VAVGTTMLINACDLPDSFGPFSTLLNGVSRFRCTLPLFKLSDVR